MSQNQQPTLLVTGAAGKLGRRVVELLLEAGAPSIIATTRTPEKLADFAAQGVTVRYADFDDPASLEAAFAGADRLLLISTDVVEEGNRRMNQHLNGVKAAEAADVSHVVYTSLIAPGPDSPVSLAPDHYATEQALEASGMSWTVLRNNIYSDQLIYSLAQAVKLGGLYSAAGDGKTAYVTREDCAQAAAAALLQPFNGRRTLDITGPEAVSQADLAAIASSLTGTQISYVALPPDVLRQNLQGVGLPPAVIDVIVTFDQGIAEGRFSDVSSAVEDLTGRKPISVADVIAQQRDVLLQATQ